MSRWKRCLIRGVAALALMGNGALIALIITAPATTNWCNARVSDAVVPRAGIPAHVTPGPRAGSGSVVATPQFADLQNQTKAIKAQVTGWFDTTGRP